MKPARNSISLRLTLLFCVFSSAVLLLLGWSIGRSVEQHFLEEDLALLSGKLELARHTLAQLRDPAALAQPSTLSDALVGHHGLSLQVLGPAGERLFAFGDAQFDPALVQPAHPPPPSRPLVWRGAHGEALRGIAGVARPGWGESAPLRVVVATDIGHHLHFMQSFRTTLWSFVVAAALLTGFLGWVAVRRGLAPLQALSHQAAGITADRLDARLPADAVPAELAELADTLNQMLARLQESFQRLSDFSSDLAHELRTPLSNLLTQTQVTLAYPRGDEQYREALASNAEECERLARMVADMLFLAKADNHLVVPQRSTVDLRSEAAGVLEFFEPLAEEKGIQLSLDGQAQVQGDRLMLRRAISNLLSNALRHTPSRGRVAVRLTQDANRVSVAVENTGTTIAAEHLPRLFDRFYRAEAARQRSAQAEAEGAGLGLAITRSIMRAHGGEARARSHTGLTVFELELPAGRAPE